MGINISHKLQPNGRYLMTFDGLNTSQAMELMKATEALIEKWEESQSEMPYGRLNVISAGKFTGNTIEDIANEQGLRPLVQIMSSYARFGKGIESRIIEGVSPYEALKLYQELLPWMLENVSGYDTLILLDAFEEYIPDAPSIRNKIEKAEGREEGWSFELERSNLLDRIFEKLTETVPVLSDDYNILYSEYKVEEGSNAGLTLKEVYDKNGLSGLVGQMLKVKKGELGFDKCKAHIACIVMLARNLIPYAEFLNAFGVFFKLNSETYAELMNKPIEEKEKDYAEKVRSLLGRIIRS